MRILIYCPVAPPYVSGLSNRISALVCELRNHGHQVLYLSLIPNHKAEVNRNNISIDSFPWDNLYPGFCFFKFYKIKSYIRLYRMIKEFSPDIIHCADPILVHFIIAPIAKYLNVPLIYSLHTDHIKQIEVCKKYTKQIVWLIKNIYYRYIFNKKNTVVALSKSHSNQLEDIDLVPTCVSTTGCDLSEFYPRSRDNNIRKEITDNYKYDFVFVYAGRCSIEKNLTRLFRLLENIPGVCCLMIGASGQYNYECPNNIYVLDKFISQEELRIYYSACDAVISASTFETLGNSVIEAMACGLPALTAKATGFVDYIIPGINGDFFDVDDIELARAKVKSFVNNASKLTTMRQHLISYRHKFCFSKYVNFYTDLYQSTINNEESK